MVRFVVRPNNIRRTPKRLARLLSARRTALVSDSTKFDWLQDVFLAYPSEDRVANVDASYIASLKFYTSNKKAQRLLLHQSGVPIVPVYHDGAFVGPEWDDTGMYVIRPLRHRAGIGFSTLPKESLLTTLSKQSEYVSPCIKKTKEFRVVYYKGQRISTYLKKVPANLDYLDPWTFAHGCVFHTVSKEINDKLNHIGFYDRLDSSVVSDCHLCAVDVLLTEDKKPYVSEVNLCPGISVKRTLSRILGVEDAITQ